MKGNTVEIGQPKAKHDRRESYVVVVNNKAQTRYRTVTDWRPSNGQVAGKYSILGFGWSVSEKLPCNNCPIYP